MKKTQIQYQIKKLEKEQAKNPSYLTSELRIKKERLYKMLDKINMNQWEIKQILDLTSKGVNSVLMHKEEVNQKELKGLAEFLVDLYSGIIADLKGEDNKEDKPF